MVLNDRVGRKISIMLSGVPSVVGLLVMGSAQNFWMLLWGRFLTGIAGGITAGSIPVSFLLFHLVYRDSNINSTVPLLKLFFFLVSLQSDLNLMR